MGRPEYGETWVYESLVGALPGVDLSARAAVGVQFLLFESAVLALGLVYGRPGAAVAGTVAVTVAALGSALMLSVSERLRSLDLPDAYTRVLFGSSVEVVLGAFAFAALVTYVFVYDPRADPALLTALFGDRPPVPAVYLALLVWWDLCYRIGTAWWTAVVGLWRTLTVDVDPETADRLRTVERDTAVFGVLQLVLAPLVVDHPVLLAALLGHVTATLAVAGASTWRLRS
jgi:hypothetical protein